MGRLIWQLRYAWMALRSPYAFTPLSAWCEAVASWDHNETDRGPYPMPTPGEALYEDAMEWRYGG